MRYVILTQGITVILTVSVTVSITKPIKRENLPIFLNRKSTQNADIKWWFGKSAKLIP